MTKKAFIQKLQKDAANWESRHTFLIKLDIHDHVKDILEEYSGGGNWHLMFHLQDNKVLNFIDEGFGISDCEFELSYNKWNNPQEYFAAEGEEHRGGLGWEYDRPDYDERRVMCGRGVKARLHALLEGKKTTKAKAKIVIEEDIVKVATLPIDTVPVSVRKYVKDSNPAYYGEGEREDLYSPYELVDGEGWKDRTMTDADVEEVVDFLTRLQNKLNKKDISYFRID